MKRIALCLTAVAVWTLPPAARSESSSPQPAGGLVPLTAAHAHNDYAHPRPLLDALDCGFCSIESDIWLVDGKLMVAHARKEIRPERTLESLYLQPLRERARLNGGRVYPGGPTILLLIDFKTEAAPTYAELRTVLQRYADILTSVEDGQVTQRAVTAIISGDAPWKELPADSPRYAMLDGRARHLGSGLPAHLVPLISENWKKLFKWQGDGPMDQAECAKLRDFVSKAHQAGRKVRFWATPDKPAVWKELRAAEVDLLSVDDLAGARKFLLEQAQPAGAR